MAAKAGKKPDGDPDESAIRETKSTVIPVIHEQATVSKRVVETGRVRIAKHVREYEEVVDVPHYQEEVTIERVPVNQQVDATPEIRREGDTTIIPVVEERYVVEKRLFVVEELHVKRERHERHNPQTVRVLKEHVEVERIPPGKSPRRGAGARQQAADHGDSKQSRR